MSDVVVPLPERGGGGAGGSQFGGNRLGARLGQPHRQRPGVGHPACGAFGRGLCLHGEVVIADLRLLCDQSIPHGRVLGRGPPRPSHAEPLHALISRCIGWRPLRPPCVASRNARRPGPVRHRRHPVRRCTAAGSPEVPGGWVRRNVVQPRPQLSHVVIALQPGQRRGRRWSRCDKQFAPGLVEAPGVIDVGDTGPASSFRQEPLRRSEFRLGVDSRRAGRDRKVPTPGSPMAVASATVKLCVCPAASVTRRSPTTSSTSDFGRECDGGCGQVDLRAGDIDGRSNWIRCRGNRVR